MKNIQNVATDDYDSTLVDINDKPWSDKPLCSGFGKYHTDKATSKKPKPFNTITLNDIGRMVEYPPSVAKEEAQWFIPSSLLTRNAEKQRQEGCFYAIWCDFDTPTELPAIQAVLTSLGSAHAIYSTRSATEQPYLNEKGETKGGKRWRVIIPLAEPATATEWRYLAAIINDRFEHAGIIPDRKSEDINQICFLPNKGEFYQFHIERNLNPIDWKTVFADELSDKKRLAEQRQATIDAQRERSRQKATIRMQSGETSPVNAYNANYPIEQSLEFYGYKRHGSKWLSPNSESGNAGVSIKDGKWVSSHGSDAGIGQPGKNGGRYGDAFDLFVHYEHGGDYKAAVIAAGTMFMVNGKTLSKANQVAFMKQTPIKPIQDDDIDYSTMPDYDEYPPQKQQIPENTSLEGGTNQHKNAQQDDKPAFKTVSLRELLNRKYTTNWLVDDLVEHGNLGLIFGNSASGKSLIIQDMCFCIAAGIDFKGKTVKQGNVLYICGEGFSGLHRRFVALSKHYGCTPDGLHLSEQPAALMDISSAAAVLDSIKEIGGVSLIVIDTFHRNMGAGDENSAKDFAQFLNNIDSFLKPTGAAILIIHHSGHDAKERSRGSSSIRAAMDFEYCVEKTDDYISMKNTKMKDYEPPQPLSFKLKVITLPLCEENGKPLTSVVLELTENKPKTGKALNGRQQDVLTALHKAITQHGIEPTSEIKALFPDTPQNSPLRVVHIDKWRELAYKVIAISGDSKDPNHAKRTAFNNCIKALIGAGKIGFYDNHYWGV